MPVRAEAASATAAAEKVSTPGRQMQAVLLGRADRQDRGVDAAGAERADLLPAQLLPAHRRRVIGHRFLPVAGGGAPVARPAPTVAHRRVRLQAPPVPLTSGVGRRKQGSAEGA